MGDEMMETIFKQSTNPAALFKLIDTDGSGSLDSGKLEAALGKFGLGPEISAQVMEALDTNKDGVIDEEEFKAGYGKFREMTDADNAGASAGAGGTGILADGKTYVVEGSEEAAKADLDFDLVMDKDLAANIYPAAKMDAARAAPRRGACTYVS